MGSPSIFLLFLISALFYLAFDFSFLKLAPIAQPFILLKLGAALLLFLAVLTLALVAELTVLADVQALVSIVEAMNRPIAQRMIAGLAEQHHRREEGPNQAEHADGEPAQADRLVEYSWSALTIAVLRGLHVQLVPGC